jgi:glc operon protein GlcG
MGDLTLDQALTLLTAAVAHARAEGVPIAASVVDDGGLTIAVHRMDGCFPSGVRLAEKKAYGALNLRAPTHLAAEGFPEAVQRALVAAEPRVTFLHGGVPIVRGGAVVGALGVTGGTGEQDVACCEVALKALDAATAP